MGKDGTGRMKIRVGRCAEHGQEERQPGLDGIFKLKGGAVVAVVSSSSFLPRAKKFRRARAQMEAG